MLLLFSVYVDIWLWVTMVLWMGLMGQEWNRELDLVQVKIHVYICKRCLTWQSPNMNLPYCLLTGILWDICFLCIKKIEFIREWDSSSSHVKLLMVSFQTEKDKNTLLTSLPLFLTHPTNHRLHLFWSTFLLYFSLIKIIFLKIFSIKIWKYASSLS